MTPLTISIARLRQHRACDLDDRIIKLSDHLGRIPADNEEIPVAAWWTFSETEVPDCWWDLRACSDRVRVKRIIVAYACRVARRALPQVNEAHTVAARAAVEAAELWLNDPTEEAQLRAHAAGRAAEDVAQISCFRQGFLKTEYAAIYTAVYAAWATGDDYIACGYDASRAASASTPDGGVEREAQRIDLLQLIEGTS